MAGMAMMWFKGHDEGGLTTGGTGLDQVSAQHSSRSDLQISLGVFNVLVDTAAEKPGTYVHSAGMM